MYPMKTRLILTACAAAALLLAGCAQPAATTSGSSLDELFLTRRSVRSYDASKTISEAEVRTIIEAAQQAPTWANTQTTRFYVAISPDKVAAVKDCVGERNAANIAGAPVVLVSTFVKDQSGFGRGVPANEIGNEWGAYDNGLNNAYFILKARDMGFDTLIMGFRESDRLRTLFGIPDTEEVMAVIALGYRAAEPGMPNHKTVDEVAKFF